MTDIANKPLAQKVYRLMNEIEMLPPSEQQTKVVTMAGAILEEIAEIEQPNWLSPICGISYAGGRYGEKIACAYPQGHDGAHSWASLPTFVNGEISRGTFDAAPIDWKRKYLDAKRELNAERDLNGRIESAVADILLCVPQPVLDAPPTVMEQSLAKIRERARVALTFLERTDADAEFRPEVLEFARLMELRLKANDHKAGWKSDKPLALLHRTRMECVELYYEIGKDPLNIEKIGKEAADVANFAMMIADVCGALDRV